MASIRNLGIGGERNGRLEPGCLSPDEACDLSAGNRPCPRPQLSLGAGTALPQSSEGIQETFLDHIFDPRLRPPTPEALGHLGEQPCPKPEQQIRQGIGLPLAGAYEQGQEVSLVRVGGRRPRGKPIPPRGKLATASRLRTGGPRRPNLRSGAMFEWDRGRPRGETITPVTSCRGS